MSKKIEYRCDLCHDVQKDLTVIKCFYWDSTIKNENNSFGKYVLSTILDKSGTHICDRCLNVTAQHAQTNVKN